MRSVSGHLLEDRSCVIIELPPPRIRHNIVRWLNVVIVFGMLLSSWAPAFAATTGSSFASDGVIEQRDVLPAQVMASSLQASMSLAPSMAGMADVSLRLEGETTPLHPGSTTRVTVVIQNRSAMAANGLTVELFFDTTKVKVIAGREGIIEEAGVVRWDEVNIKAGERWQKSLIVQVGKRYGLQSTLTVRVQGEDLYATRHQQLQLTTEDPPMETVRVLPGKRTIFSALDGRLTLEIPAKAVEEPLMISLKWLRPRAQDPSWLTERFELSAVNGKGEQVNMFAAPLQLTLRQSVRPIGVNIAERAMRPPVYGNMAFFWLDEATKEWRSVPGTYDVKSQTVVAQITHFSNWGAGSDANFDSLGLPQLNVDAASLFSGAFTYAYPLAAPAGPHGFGPHLSLAYNDETANSAWDGDRTAGDIYRSQASIVGYSWQIGGLGKITVDWYSDPKRVFLSFAGGRYELKYVNQKWRTEPEGFLQIWRDGVPGNDIYTDLLRADANWHVLDQNGTEYTFGNGMNAGTAYFRRDNEANCGASAYAYYLTKVEDVHGNYWTVDYERDQTDWTNGAQGNCDDEATNHRNVIRATRPKYVRLYHKNTDTNIVAKVGEYEFVYEQRSDTDIKDRDNTQSLWSEYRVRQIIVRSKDNNDLTEIFRYQLDYHYSHGTAHNCGFNNTSRTCTESLLDTVTVTPQVDPGGGTGLSRSSHFSYWTHSCQQWSGTDINFSAIYLQKIQNGRGGELFLYREAHDVLQSGQQYETQINGHYRQRLLATRVTGGMGNYVWTTFSYSGGAYDTQGTSQKDDDEFAGYATVDARLHEKVTSSSETPPAHSGSLRSKTLYSFKQGLGNWPDDVLRGKLWRTDAYISPTGSVYNRVVNGFSAVIREADEVAWSRLDKTLWHVDKGGEGWDKRCTTYSYNTALQGGEQYGLITHAEERPDWCSSTPYRTAITQYAVKNDGSSHTYMVRPAQKKVKDGGGVCRSLTQYFYYAGDAMSGNQEAGYGNPGNKGLLRRARTATDTDDDCGTVSSWAESKYDYYADGNAKRSTQPPNHAGVQAWTETVWDAVHGAYAVQEINNLGQSRSATYDLALGVVQTTTDVNGVTNEFEYDGYGRLRKSWLEPQDKSATPNTPTEKIDYYKGTTANNKACSNSWCVHDMKLDEAGGDNYLHSYTFRDGLGRTIQTQAESEGGQHSVTDVWYHETGQVKKQSIPYSVSGVAGTYINPAAHPATQYQYDGLGRGTVVTAPDGSQTKTYYQGYKTAVIDALNHLTMQASDDWGRLAQAWQYTGVYPSGPPTEPNSSVWDTTGSYATATYDYDVLDRLTSVTAPGGANTTIAYDVAGRKKSMSDPDMGVWSYSYDAAGNLRTQTDANGAKLCFYYDDLNRLTHKYASSGACSSTAPADSQVIAHFYYDGAYPSGQQAPAPVGKVIGKRTAQLWHEGATFNWSVYSYDDARGRLSREQTRIDSKWYTTNYAYDAMDRVKTLKYPKDVVNVRETVTFNYDAGGVNHISGSNVYVQNITHTPLGQMDALTLGSNLRTIDYIYNTTTDQRLKQIKSSVSSEFDRTYTYDAVGNVTKITDAAFPTGTSGSWSVSTETQTYGYDELNRILTYTASGVLSKSYTYEYHPNGNFSKYRSYTGLAFKEQDDIKFGPDSDYPDTPHALVSYASEYYCYDKNGNQVKRILGTDTWLVDYTAENKVERVRKNGATKAKYFYNGDGDRVKSVVGNVTTYYIGNLYERSVGGDCHNGGSCDTKYYYASGKLVSLRRQNYAQSNGLRYIFEDHLNSTSLVIDSGGAKLYADYFTPFGGYLRKWTNTVRQTDYRFTGQRHESDIKLYDYRARFYDNRRGRFTQPDTMVPDPGDPQSLNRYSYAGNNPLRYTDPSGHSECITDDCNLAWHPVSHNVVMRKNTVGSSLYNLITLIAVGKSSAQSRLRQILSETGGVLPAQFEGIGAARGDKGFAQEFQDDHLYGELWGIERPASRQLGHFLTAVRMGDADNDYLRLAYLYAIVGHEQKSDGKGKIGQMFGLMRQSLAPSRSDVSAFRIAVEQDAAGAYEARDATLYTIFDPKKHGDPANRIGNSMEDLRLSVRGWRLGAGVRQGEFTTNKDVANWLALYVAGGGR